MFVAAVSKDAADGKIGLYPCIEKRTYQKNSKNHNKDDHYWVDVPVDCKFYSKILCENIFTDVIKKIGNGKVIIIQHDNPKTHKGLEVDAVFKDHKDFVNHYQPPQSPDLNPLDQ